MKPKPCPCGGHHTAFLCPRKPRKTLQVRSTLKRVSRLRTEAVKTRQKRQQTTREWDKANPPDHTGRWECYLKIAPNCHGTVTKETLNREHTLSKARHPEAKYDITKIKPACPPCNALKGSQEVKEVKSYAARNI